MAIDQDDGATRLSWRNRLANPLLIVVGLAALVGVNWPYRYEVATSEASPFYYEGDLQPDAGDVPSLVLGGWPMRFYERVEYPQASTSTHWSTPPLLVNVALGAAAIAVLFMYHVVRQRRLKAVRGQQGQLTLMDILLLALLLAAPLAYWRYLDRVAQRDGALAARIAQHGRYRREALVPAWLTTSLPGPLVQACLRTTMVRLDNPPDDLVVAALNHSRLRALRIGGGGYDLRLLDRLPSMTRLHDLAIEGRVIDAQTLQRVGGVEQLRTLSLRRTNVSAESLQLLNPLQRLRLLDLRGTEVQLDAADYGPWASSIEHVALPRPDPGVEASMKLDGWPSLKRLICAELDASLNRQPMQIVLTNLPKLESLELDRLQMFALEATGLPNLTHLGPADFQSHQRIGASQRLPGSLWVSALRLHDVPRLQHIKCFGGALESLSIRGAEGCESLGIGVFEFDSNNQPHYDAKIPYSVRQAWIDGIGQSDGPPVVDLAAVPLSGVDLSPLRKNPKLRTLDLSTSGTSLPQWKGLAGMEQLETLKVSECSIDGQGVEWLAKNLPGLRVLSCDGFGVDRLRIENAPSLQRIDWGDSGVPALHALRLVNVPRLDQLFKLSRTIVHLHVEDAPALAGLIQCGVLPDDAVLQGFPTLRIFAAGGAQVDDDLAKELLQCRNMKNLGLVYTSISPDLLAELGGLPQLTLLEMSGSAVDDRVLSQWQHLGTIKRLRLNDTQLSGTSVRRLMRYPQWEELGLGNVKAKEEDLEGIEKLRSLTKLRLAGWQLSADMLAQIASLPNLQRLDLSGMKIDAAMIDAIAAAALPQLTELILRGCTVDNAALVRLAQSCSQIRFDLREADVSVDVEVALAGAKRVLYMDDESDVLTTAMRARLQRMMATGQRAVFVMPQPSVEFDAQYFAPQDGHPSEGPAIGDSGEIL